jgi:hypothetical protein
MLTPLQQRYPSLGGAVRKRVARVRRLSMDSIAVSGAVMELEELAGMI